ncbi:MAG: hypothetical protein QXZ68_06740 [Candidatus Bathyarchaeia archaeon]
MIGVSLAIPLYWKPPPWMPPPGFPQLPACWEWHEGDPLPDFLVFVKGELDEAMYFKICLENLNPPKITVVKRNIKEIDLCFHGAFKWFGRWVHDPEAVARQCEDYIRRYHPTFDIDIDSDIPEEHICFVIPATWRVKNVLKNGMPIPWRRHDDKICFTITHESPTLITLALSTETEQLLETTSTVMMTIAFSVMVTLMIMQLLTTVIREFKWK